MRGVRQGDPLSCPLFNLAIEPLACKIRNDTNIKGYKIPGIIEKIVLSLYTDDTCLFLSKEDNLDYIQEMLEEWCRASGAKFNIEKTKIVPIGTPTHRMRMLTTQKLNPTERNPIDNKIRIAEEREAVRLLGAWIGNNTDAATPWELVIDRIQKALGRYSKSHPTLHGRKVIAQIIIGGHIQFLMKAQGMPKHIENALIKILRSFIWEENNSPRIALEYLYQTIGKGGLNLLDIRARNEAIEIMWLKAYLNLSPTRPAWAKITDIILDATTPQGYNTQARMNTFLQTWNIPTKGTRAGKLNDDATRMLRAARDHNANFASIKLTPSMKQNLPAWFQIGARHWPINNKAAKCLLTKHQIKTIVGLLKASAKIRNNVDNNHRPTNFCHCRSCTEDHRKGCVHPYDCAQEALARIQSMTPKMNPLHPGNTDNLSLTRRRKEQNRRAKEVNGTLTFNPSLTSKDDISECFRVFADPQKHSKHPAECPRNNNADERHRKITAYMDGACINNGKENARCGGRVWFSQNNPKNSTFKVPGDKQSNQIGELAVVIVAIQAVPTFCPLEIIMDSRYIINGLISHLQSWEDRGWIRIQMHNGLKRRPTFSKGDQQRL